MEKQQLINKTLKENPNTPLFDKCFANVPDEIIKEINDKLDGRLNKTKN